MRIAIPTVALLVGLAGSAAGQSSDLVVPYSQFTLPNGLNVILHQDHTTPRVTFNLWYRVGSAHERPGRTGFAHLFEHIMFEGSANVPEGKIDEWFEAVGGSANGSTTPDRTNYFQTVGSNAIDLGLFIESDRMGFLLDAMSPASVDGQRDVVKNERRQSYENRPYGLAFPTLGEQLYPADHPYHWPTIGYMEDLTAATYEDVVDFFRRYYAPNNASIAIVGDIDPETVRRRVEHWFSDVPAGPPVSPIERPEAFLTQEKRVVLEDRVQLPRLYMCWLTPPVFQPGDAELDVAADVMAGGKNSRLFRRLVYDLQIAQDVSAFQRSGQLSSSFCITTTARSGYGLSELEVIVQEEIDRLKAEPPNDREVTRAVNQIEVGFLDRLEFISGKADQLNRYATLTGNPDYFNEDLARYQAIGPSDITAVIRTHLADDRRVVLSVVPTGRGDLAATPRNTSDGG